jgi:hypothetical protein
MALDLFPKVVMTCSTQGTLVHLAADNVDMVVTAAMKLYKETNGRIAGINLS